MIGKDYIANLCNKRDNAQKTPIHMTSPDKNDNIVNELDGPKEELREELKELQQEFLSSIKDIDSDKRDQLKQELAIALHGISLENEEKARRVAKLIIANLEVKFLNEEKAERAAELVIANIELVYQNKEKSNRAAELIIANKELVFQNEEKAKRAAELDIANIELVFQIEEKAKRAAELILANKELVLQNEEKEKMAIELIQAKENAEENEKEQTKLAGHLKLATDSAKVGIWSLDVVSLKLEWSDIHKKLWGYDGHREELTFEDWHSAIVPEDKESTLQKIEESKVDHGIYEVDYRINRANDGAVVWIKSSGQYQYDAFDEARTLSGISIDITEQKSFTNKLEIKVKQRTAALKKSNEELQRTNTQLNQFAYVASHDLQEPLRKILTFSARLRHNYKKELGTEAKTYLNKIEGASGRMKILIEDLLNYSRLLEHEKSFVPTDLDETLKNILNDFELLVDEKKAQIQFDELPTIDAVPLQMNQLFYNLMSNALKFSREDVPPVITITSRTLPKKQFKRYPALNPSMAYVEMIVKDNGIGFELQYSKQIFTIFQRLQSKEMFIGTGIGLALTKKITENHQGVIFADAEENKGASFHVILPLKQPL